MKGHNRLLMNPYFSFYKLPAKTMCTCCHFLNKSFLISHLYVVGCVICAWTGTQSVVVKMKISLTTRISKGIAKNIKVHKTTTPPNTITNSTLKI